MKRLLCLVLFLVGCTTIATEGPVEEISVPADQPGIEIAPQPPQPDDSQARIVEGFLLAIADPDSDFSVAQTYLTADAANRWSPTEELTVYAGNLVESEDGITANGQVVGRVNRQGHFQPATDRLEHNFGVVEEAGQWRISNPPEQVLITQYLFERYYAPITIYFADSAGQNLVPDFRVVPETRRTPESVVRRLFQGPSPRLKPIVYDPMPATVRLAREGASIDELGTVTVDFAGLDIGMAMEQRRLLGAQLLWSMAAVPRVTGLRVHSDGWPFHLPGQNASGVLTLDTLHSYQVLSHVPAGELLAVREGVVGYISEADEFRPMGLNSSAAEVAISIDQRKICVVNAGRSTMVLGERDQQLDPVSPELTGLRETQWAGGKLYGLGEDARGHTRLFRVSQERELELLRMEYPEDQRIRSFSINQAGGWVAVLPTGDDAGLVMATLNAGELRGWQRMPVYLPSGEEVTQLRDVRWTSDSTLVVLGQVGDTQAVFSLRADGTEVRELGRFTEHVGSVTALPRAGGGPVAARLRSGTVLKHVPPNRWVSTEIEASSITYAG